MYLLLPFTMKKDSNNTTFMGRNNSESKTKKERKLQRVMRADLLPIASAPSNQYKEKLIQYVLRHMNHHHDDIFFIEIYTS
jgi:hypothetical protein